MNTIKLLIGCAALLAQVAVAQTPDTNDVRIAWNVQCNYSTNQFAGLQWAYRQYTNQFPQTNIVGEVTNVVTAPTLVDWHREQIIRPMAARVAEDYARQRKEAEQAQKSFVDLRERWADLTPAQRQAVLSAAGL